MKSGGKLFVSLLGSSLVSLGLSTAASAQTLDQQVLFDCSGEMTGIVDSEDGPRATGQVELTMDLPNGAVWRSAGVVVIEIPPRAADKKIAGRKISQCMGEARMTAEVITTLQGVDIWSIRLEPTRVRVRVGNQRISDPTRLGFESQAGGSPNV